MCVAFPTPWQTRSPDGMTLIATVFYPPCSEVLLFAYYLPARCLGGGRCHRLEEQDSLRRLGNVGVLWLLDALAQAHNMIDISACMCDISAAAALHTVR